MSKQMRKIKEYERIVEWDFTSFNKTIVSLFEIENIWQLVFYPFWMFIISFFYLIFYPLYIISHLISNREVYYKDRYWRLK